MDKAAVNSAQKQRGKPFQKGVSGNPSGKPRGARHKATVLAEQLMQGQLEQVVQTVIDAALAGDMTACKLVVERLVPVRRDRAIEPGAVKLPVLKPENLPAASRAVVAAVAGGKLTPSEGEALARVLEGHRKAVETLELETRLAKLEAAMGGN